MASLTSSREYDADDHLLTLPQLMERYGTAIDLQNPSASLGLPVAAIPSLQAKHGRNVLTPPAETSAWIQFVRGFGDMFMVLLQAAAWFCILASWLQGWDRVNLTLGIVLFAVVILTVTMTFLQDRQTSSVMATFKKMLPAQCTVIRDGKEARIAASELVPGDLCLLSLGDRVPADVRIITHRELKVEASSLTGESDAISCSVEAQHELPAEARNLVFNSSLVMNGEGRGVVVRTGDRTMIGSIASLATATVALETTMQIEVRRVVHFITALAFVSALVFFAIGVGRIPTREGALNAFINGFIVVLVANVPEGLPGTVATCLTITAKRMAAKNVFIKKTAIIETLGSASVICSDKTGTLTQNRMTVENMWCSRGFVTARSGAARASSGARGVGDGLLFSAQSSLNNTYTKPGGGTIYGGTIGVSSRTRGSAGSRGSASGIPRSLSREGPRGLSALFAPLGRPSRDDSSLPPQTASVSVTVASDGAAPVGPIPVVSGDVAYAMSIGRAAVPSASGDGTLTIVSAKSFRGGIPDWAPQAANAAATPKPALQLPPPVDAGLPVLPECDEGTLSPAARPVTGAGALPAPTPLAVAPRSALLQGALGSLGHVSSLSLGTGHTQASLRAALAGMGGTQGRRGGGLSSLLSWRRASPYLRLVTAAGVCNRARFVEADAVDTSVTSGGSGFHPSASERKVLGDASDTAFLRYVDGVIPIAQLRRAYPILHEVPFNSVNKWSCAFVADPEEPGTCISLLKGAPEIVLSRCSHYLYNGEERPIDDDFLAEHSAAYERFGFSGERVLGFAYRSVAASASGPCDEAGQPSYPTSGLVFCGLISLVDPPRDGVDEAVGRCRAGGIRVTMVTGDHPLTAEAIARKVGIITLPTARDVAEADGSIDEEDVPLSDPRVRAVVRSGAQIRGMSQGQWDELLGKEEVVFARTSPQQKLEICENYQRLGHIVAMTGDGVNDSPALKKANIGVAMGSASASDVAREAAEIILMDDNFASIVLAIEEGRTLFDNLKKSIAYTLSHLWPELFPVLLNLAFSFPLGLPGLIILLIDLLTEQGPAISFAYEKAEEAVMQRPPRDLVNDRLISRGLLFYSYLVAGVGNMLVCMFAYLAVFAQHGVPVASLAWSAETYWKEGAPDLIVPGRSPLGSSEQLDVYHEAVGAWTAMLIACQFWNVWVCKTRFMSLWTHGVFDNFVTLVGVAFELAVLIMVVYVPWLQGAFQTNAVAGIIWPIQFIFGAFILTYSEAGKAWTRRYPDSWYARNLAW